MNPQQIALTVRQRDRLAAEVAQLRAEVLRLRQITSRYVRSDVELWAWLSIEEAKTRAALLREPDEVTGKRRAELLAAVS